MTAARHGLVLLAAGASRRLGTPKQLLCLDGETLIHRAARLALATAPHDALVVLGHAAGAVGAALADLPVRHVHCRDWQGGLGASLATGLAALEAACSGALVVLCDQPGLTAAHLAALVAAWHARPEGAAASGYAGAAGVPAMLPRAWFAALDAGGDRGARDLLRARQSEIVIVPDDGLAADIDQGPDAVRLGLRPSEGSAGRRP